jgi:hypothetical protein
LAILLLFGVGLMVASPLLRRYNRAPAALAAGALEVLAICVLGLVRIDPRIGQAAIAANRRSYLMIVAWELPVLILARESKYQRTVRRPHKGIRSSSARRTNSRTPAARSETTPSASVSPPRWTSRERA